MLYCHLQHHNDTIIKTQEDFLIKIFISHFIARVRKGLLKVCVWEGAGDRTELKYFDPHSYGRQRCVFLVLQLLNRTPRAHSAGWWLSLLHLLSIFSGPHFSSISISNSTATATWLLSWLSYIIVQRTLDRPLDLWNRMFDRHQAEITIMQFTGHSLPVRQSMSVPWEFFTSSHFI